MKNQFKFNIEEAIIKRGEDAELLVLIACLVQKLGNNVTIDMESIEEVMHCKELVMTRNDLDDNDEPSVTLTVNNYVTADIN